MSYRVNCDARRARKLAAKQRGPRLVRLSDVLKWHYPRDPHPWWVLTAVQAGWMTTQEGRVAEERWWAEQGPPKLSPFEDGVCLEVRGAAMNMGRSASILMWGQPYDHEEWRP